MQYPMGRKGWLYGAGGHSGFTGPTPPLVLQAYRVSSRPPACCIRPLRALTTPAKLPAGALLLVILTSSNSGRSGRNTARSPQEATTGRPAVGSQLRRLHACASAGKGGITMHMHGACPRASPRWHTLTVSKEREWKGCLLLTVGR